MEFNFINSMLYLLLLFSSSRGGSDGLLGGGSGDGIGGGILGRGNGLIFLAIILLCLKDVETCICEPECHCEHERERSIEREIDFLRADIARAHYSEPFMPQPRGNYYDPFVPPRCRPPIRQQDFV